MPNRKSRCRCIHIKIPSYFTLIIPRSLIEIFSSSSMLHDVNFQLALILLLQQKKEEELISQGSNLLISFRHIRPVKSQIFDLLNLARSLAHCRVVAIMLHVKSANKVLSRRELGTCINDHVLITHYIIKMLR